MQLSMDSVIECHLIEFLNERAIPSQIKPELLQSLLEKGGLISFL